jgi:hypothetical protein
VDLPDGLLIEKQAFAVLCSTKDQKEGMKAFLEKRPRIQGQVKRTNHRITRKEPSWISN